jgi:hypothetical protein
MSYQYKITSSYCWYNNGSMIVKMYFINGLPFTFDELPDGHLRDKELIKEANKSISYEPDEMYRYSFYLIDEEMHPMLFPVDLENPEDMPDQEIELCDEQDFMR